MYLGKVVKLSVIAFGFLLLISSDNVVQKSCKNHFYSDSRNGTEISKNISGKLHSCSSIVIHVLLL